MKKFNLLMTLGLMLFATALSAQLPPPEDEQPRMVGNDRDEHGCIGSAGYVWSKVRQECIRTFEAGVALNPVNKKEGEVTLVATIVFGSNNNKVEVFIPGQKNSVVLTPDMKDKTWTGSRLTLKEIDGKYILSKKGKAIYKN